MMIIGVVMVKKGKKMVMNNKKDPNKDNNCQGCKGL
jgi:hypothetical protein